MAEKDQPLDRLLVVPSVGWAAWDSSPLPPLMYLAQTAFFLPLDEQILSVPLNYISINVGLFFPPVEARTTPVEFCEIFVRETREGEKEVIQRSSGGYAAEVPAHARKGDFV